MRGVLSSEDLQTKREFQDLSYRLLKMRDEMSAFFSPFPDFQKPIVKALDVNAGLLGQVQGLDSSAVSTLQTVIGNIEQLVRLIHNGLDFYAPNQREPAERHARVLDKILVKLKNYEEVIYKKGFGRSVA